MPSSLRPVQQNLFGDGNAPKPADAAAQRQTHIEVCARIRPLQISMQSSSSYFGADHQQQHALNDASPSRKPPVPASLRKGGIPPPGSTKKGISNSNNNVASVAPEDLFYAWDVVGDDTAAQSSKTDIVPGRTHQYTLDKVYGPSSTTRDMYNQSVKDLVHSAMEGRYLIEK